MKDLMFQCRDVAFYSDHIEYDKNKVINFAEGNQGIKLSYEDQQLALNAAKDAVKARLEHCIDGLHKNLETSKVRNTHIVVWDKGHFSAPVFKTLESIQEVKSWEELDIPQCQQILRALYENASELTWDSKIQNNAFQIASELIICLSWNNYVDSH